MIGVIGLDVDKDVLYLRELMDDLGFDTISKLMRSSNGHARINQYMQIGIYITLRTARTNTMRIPNACDIFYDLANFLFGDSSLIGKSLKSGTEHIECSIQNSDHDD